MAPSTENQELGDQRRREKKEASDQRKREREKARYAANRETLAMKKRLHGAKKRYDEATKMHQNAILFWNEAYHFSQCRKRELATRLSILRAEMKQMQSSSEYLTDYFAEPLPGEPPNALLLEVNTDIQSLARDIHTSETRFEYYEEREEICERTRREEELALAKEKNKYTRLCQEAKAAEEIEKIKEIAHRPRPDEFESPDSPLTPSSNPLKYSAASLSHMAAVRSDEERCVRGNKQFHRREEYRRDTAMEELDDLDSDGQVPIPQADWDD